MTDIMCEGCLGMLSDEEKVEERTPCCDREFLVGVDYSQYDLDVDIFNICLINSNKEKVDILRKVKALPADSKKRRQGYTHPADTWPGKLTQDTASYKARKRSGKRAPSGKKTHISLDITSENASSNTEGWSVVITGKIKNTIYGQDRGEARKKARSYLRGIGSSITTASEVRDEGNKTIIHYGEEG